MRIQVFSVFDSKIGTFAQPWFSATVESGKRAFIDACSDPNTLLWKHLEDFSLFHLGEFDDDTGTFSQGLPANLGLAAQFKVKES